MQREGLWGCTIEEVLERLAANQLRYMLEDNTQANEWFPGGLSNIVYTYGDNSDDNNSHEELTTGEEP